MWSARTVSRASAGVSCGIGSTLCCRSTAARRLTQAMRRRVARRSQLVKRASARRTRAGRPDPPPQGPPHGQRSFGVTGRRWLRELELPEKKQETIADGLRILLEGDRGLCEQLACRYEVDREAGFLMDATDLDVRQPPGLICSNPASFVRASAYGTTARGSESSRAYHAGVRAPPLAVACSWRLGGTRPAACGEDAHQRSWPQSAMARRRTGGSRA